MQFLKIHVEAFNLLKRWSEFWQTVPGALQIDVFVCAALIKQHSTNVQCFCYLTGCIPCDEAVNYLLC